MKETQLDGILGTKSEPIKNVYKFKKRSDIEKIQSICRIFIINEEQKIKHKMIALNNLSTMKIVISNN